MTASSTARVRCDRPGRYARLLVNRFAQTAHTDWDSEQGRAHLAFTREREGEVDLIAGDGVLLMQLECPAEELDQFEAMIGGGLVEIAAGTGLQVLWKRSGGQEGTRWVADLDEKPEGLE
ncbi:DUF2218 domain-containing protein [Corynebacterium comes]|uniref:DUF2218 domain-containing protein n=1 Tax=Corynebacterium comes TaxID=2675218 RepID=A0A6B8W380_9CORY|nr:DUF2218 domain-containing protein [Corynebacterium comes]QGU04240.1 hypothetical protein CETAM_04845 [Corynebacterium comes]